MEYKDYYKVLGLERSASADEVRKAYRKLAMQYHPDRNPGDKASEEKFKEINEAYQVLSDSQKRARYDQLGSAYSNWEQRSGGQQGDFDWSQWFSGQPAGSGGTRVEFGDLNDLFGGQEAFSDFFRSIFGGGGATQTATRGRPRQSYQQPVTISLDEVYRGSTRTLQSNDRRLEVRIPPGVKTGSKVRVAGGGPAGSDLYLIVDVAPDPRFEREGDDLRTSAGIDIFTAVLGGEAQVDTLEGKVTLKIPAGTQPDQVFRLSGRGLPPLKSPQKKGDLFVRVKVTIPKKLSAKQRALLEEAARLKSE
jgi:curved DNA-binding protein